MEHEDSLPHSQVPSTCPYPEPDQSSPCPQPTSRRPILILSFHLLLVLPSGFFHSGFPTKTLHAPLLSHIRATCPAHHILLGWITRRIFGDEYRSYGSSLCSFLLVTSFPLGPNILLSTLFSSALNLRFSFIVSDQFSHPWKQQELL